MKPGEIVGPSGEDPHPPFRAGRRVNRAGWFAAFVVVAVAALGGGFVLGWILDACFQAATR